MPKIKRAKPIPGIVGDARRLDVSHYHLWAVLKGRRKSPRLIERYRKLQEQKGS